MRVLDKDPIVEALINQYKHSDDELEFFEKLVTGMIETDIKGLASEDLIEIITKLFKYKIELESMVLCLAISRTDKVPDYYD